MVYSEFVIFLINIECKLTSIFLCFLSNMQENEFQTNYCIHSHVQLIVKALPHIIIREMNILHSSHLKACFPLSCDIKLIQKYTKTKG